jgi:PAS domain S-box-containing protein
MTIRPPDPTLRLAAIVESSDDAIVSKDLNGIVTSWNKGAENLFGYTADEAIGQSIAILIPPDRLSEEAMVLGRIRRGERVEHFDTIRRRKDGTLVPVSLTVSPIRDADGTVVGASKIARNISDRNRIEADLEALRQRLMSLVVASASILGSPDSGTITSKAIELAREVFAADGYALWRMSSEGAWRIVQSYGISNEFAARAIVRSIETHRAPVVPFSEPLVCEDVQAAPMLADLRDAYAREGIATMVVFPLSIRGERSGTMVFYSHRRVSFRPIDVQVGAALANLVAAAMTTADLYEEQRNAREAADHARQQAAFLAQAATVLGASLDYEETLRSLAKLAVPTIADWCAKNRRRARRSRQSRAGTIASRAVSGGSRRCGRCPRSHPHRQRGVYVPDPSRSPGSRGSGRGTYPHHSRTPPDVVYVRPVDRSAAPHRSHHIRQRGIRQRIFGRGSAICARACLSRVARRRKRAGVRARQRSEPPERRVSGDALARTTHAAQCGPRLRQNDADADAPGRKNQDSLGRRRTQRHLAQANHRGRPGRVTDRGWPSAVEH